MSEQNPTANVHACPKGHVLTARAIADSEYRIWTSWLECQTCGWKSGDFMTAEHLLKARHQ